MVKNRKFSKSEKEVKLRRDFYSFQKKVNHLEEFKHELDSLVRSGQTRGFEKEVSIIRSRLKDTTAIPEIGKKIRNLRISIRKRKEPKKKYPIKKIASKVNQIDKGLDEINKDVESTNRKLQKRFDIVDENVITVNRQLKNEIKVLKETLDKSLDKKGHINSEIGVVVDDQFHKFINDIKIDLSKKVKNKEHELNSQLKNDLALRKRELELQYNKIKDELEESYSKRNIDLEKKYKDKKSTLQEESKKMGKSYLAKEVELNTRYEKKQEDLENDYKERVKNQLVKEVHDKFNKELRKKFEQERAKLDYYYVSNMKKKYHDDFEKQKNSLNNRFKIRLSQEIKKHDLEENELKRKNQAILRAKLNVLSKKEMVFNLKKKELSKMEKKQKDKLSKKVMQIKKERIEDEKKLANIKLSLKAEISREAHEEFVRKVAENKKKIGNELKKEFNKKIKDFVVHQNKSKNKEIEAQIKQFNEALLNQKKIDAVLKTNLSKAKYDLEQHKQKIKQLLQEQTLTNKNIIDQRIKIKHEEMVKRQMDHKSLLIKHRADIQKVTENLVKKFHNEFDMQYSKQLKIEKERLNKEFRTNKKNLKDRLSKATFKERRKVKLKLKEDYKNKLLRTKGEITKRLQVKLKKELEKISKQKLDIEKEKLQNKLRELEEEHNAREASLKLKEKELLQHERNKTMSAASEKKRLLEKLNIIKSQNEMEFKEEKIKMQKEINYKAHKQMINELRIREKLIKAKFEKEFGQKLKMHDLEQENIIKRRKEELANELRKKAQSLLN